MKLVFLARSLVASLRIAVASRNPFIPFKSNIICKGTLLLNGRIYGLRSCHIQVEEGASLSIGSETHFSEFIQIRCSNHIEIGNHVRIAPFCILSDSLYKDLGSSNPQIVLKKVIIEEECFVAPFSFICGNVHIGKASIIGPHTNLKNQSLAAFTLLTKSKQNVFM